MNDWIKLERGNDWGRFYWTLPGKRLKNGYASFDLGLYLPEGTRLSVRWPNGSETEERVAHKTYADKVSDMGHDDNFAQREIGFHTFNRGVPTWTMIHEVEVRLAEIEVLQVQKPR